MSAIKDALPNHILVNLKTIKMEVKDSVLNVLNIKMNSKLNLNGVHFHISMAN